MKLNRSELKIIADSLRTLKVDGIIRSKNLVGDLGEFYCQQKFSITLNKNPVTKGFDGIDTQGKKVEIKTRRDAENTAKIIFRSFEFDYCLLVELDEFYELTAIRKIPREEILENVDKKGDRLSFAKIKKLGTEVFKSL